MWAPPPPMGSMVFTVMAALVQMELEITGERVTDSVAKRRGAGKGPVGRGPTITASQIRNEVRLIEARSQQPRSLGLWECPGRPSAGAFENSPVEHLSKRQLRNRWRAWRPLDGVCHRTG